ncbi:MAG: hypothetical protein ABWY04_01835 [Arthrobacter sp.]
MYRGVDQVLAVGEAQRMRPVELVVDEVPSMELFEPHRQSHNLGIAHAANVLLEWRA